MFKMSKVRPNHHLYGSAVILIFFLLFVLTTFYPNASAAALSIVISQDEQLSASSRSQQQRSHHYHSLHRREQLQRSSNFLTVNRRLRGNAHRDIEHDDRSRQNILTSCVHGDIRDSSKRVQDIISVIDNYKKAHSFSVIGNESAESICSRKFISSYHFPLSCDSMGNHLSPLLSSTIAALVLNRTLYGMSEMFACDDAIELDDFIIRKDEILALSAKADCGSEFDHLLHEPPPLFGHCPFTNISATCYDGFHSALMELQPDVIGRIYGNDSYQAKTARTIFSSPERDTSRFEIYGFLIHEIFRIQPNIFEMVDPILHDIRNHINHDCLHNISSATIGVHVRHQNHQGNSMMHPELDIPHDERIMMVMEEVRNQSNAQHCIFLISSDRTATIRRLIAKARLMGCESRYVEKDTPVTIDYKPDDQEIHTYHEHGPFHTLSGSVADWYLLGHSQYLIASSFSSFSWLMAMSVAYRAALLEHYDGDMLTKKLPTQREPMLDHVGNPIPDLSPLVWVHGFEAEGGRSDGFFSKEDFDRAGNEEYFLHWTNQPC